MEIHNYDTYPKDLDFCPFCGGIASIHLIGQDVIGKKRIVEVECTDCHTIQRTGGIYLSTKNIVKIALKKWNSRK